MFALGGCGCALGPGKPPAVCLQPPGALPGRGPCALAGAGWGLGPEPWRRRAVRPAEAAAQWPPRVGARAGVGVDTKVGITGHNLRSPDGALERLAAPSRLLTASGRDPAHASGLRAVRGAGRRPASGRGALCGAAPHNSSRAVSAGSLGDMEAGEEAQAADTSLLEREATALEPEALGEPEPLSPSSPGEPVVGAEGGLHHPGRPCILAANFTEASSHSAATAMSWPCAWRCRGRVAGAGALGRRTHALKRLQAASFVVQRGSLRPEGKVQPGQGRGSPGS